MQVGVPSRIQGVRLGAGSLPALQRSGELQLEGTTVGGYASVIEQPYEMYDMFGPYNEVVSRGAFGKTLASSPLVEFTVNHGAGGALPMAHTRNGTLQLWEDETGLGYDASVDTARSDVMNLVLALARGDMAEASFKFHIDAGLWSPDYTEFRIAQVDLDHGDVSAVNFGASPFASSGLRSQMEQLAGRLAEKRALDPEDVNMLTQALAWFASVDLIVDQAQESLASYLGVSNPDDDELETPAEDAGERAASGMTFAQLLAG
jgi:HK97 family phage prohead protease